MPLIALRSWPRSSGSSPRAARRWSATPASALSEDTGEDFAIDPDKIEEGKRFDGVFVLRTDTDLNPLEAMLCYLRWHADRSCDCTGEVLVRFQPLGV
jgi:hypothetical protein